MKKRNVILAAGLSGLTALGAGAMPASAAKVGTIKQFALPAPRGPMGITVGPDGNMWFSIITPCCDSRVHDLGRLTPSGQVTEYTLSAFIPQVISLTAGPDGNVWFAEFQGSRIGYITPQGAITELDIPPVDTPSGPVYASPQGIALGPDGNLWFTGGYAGFIGRVTPAGVFTEFPVNLPNASPIQITAGPDGNMWYTETGAVGRITMSGDVTEFPSPTPNDPEVSGITKGPDGNLWFTEANANNIGRITPVGVITEFPIAGNHIPANIAAGHDGALWFTEAYVSAPGVGRITTAGKYTEYFTPNIRHGGITGITPGPPSNPKTMWFGDQYSNFIDVITTR